MASDELCSRVHHDVSTPFHWPTQPWRGKGRVNNQRQTVAVCHVGQRLEISNRSSRVADDLGIHRLGLGPDRRSERVDVGVRNKRCVNPEPTQRRIKECVGAAVYPSRGNDVIASAHQRRHSQEGRCLTAGRSYSTNSAFEARHTFFKCSRGWVGDPAVDSSELLQRKQVRRIVGVLEHEAGRLIDGDGSCSRGRVRLTTSVQRASLESEFVITHPLHSSTRPCRTPCAESQEARRPRDTCRLSRRWDAASGLRCE